MSHSGYEGDALEKHLLWKVSESRMWRQCINNRVSINVPFNSGSSRGERWYRRDETFCENCSCVICSFLSLGAGNDCHKSFPGESSALSSKHYAFLPFNEQLVVFIFFVGRVLIQISRASKSEHKSKTEVDRKLE